MDLESGRLYTTCLFCHRDLGRNEVVEHFPVGRRLAFDGAKGRLWVVCRQCERWNLTPLETRWEAIEEAERLFRSTRLRITTENIGLVRLSEGLELVRIGAPPQLEFAAWRYGDPFGRRRRRHLLYGSLGVAVPALALLGGALGAGLAGVVLVSGTTNLVNNIYFRRRNWQATHVPTLFLTDDAGGMLPLTRSDLLSARLVPRNTTGDWQLTLNHRVLHPPANMESGRRRAARDPATLPATLTGALSLLLPHANHAGASERRVRAAVAVIDSSSSLQQLLYQASMNRFNTQPLRPGSLLRQVAEPLRLALEMVLHHDDERRAFEGELHLLEQRWQEAERIASIADSLYLPAAAQARFEALRRKDDA